MSRLIGDCERMRRKATPRVLGIHLSPRNGGGVAQRGQNPFGLQAAGGPGAASVRFGCAAVTFFCGAKHGGEKFHVFV